MNGYWSAAAAFDGSGAARSESGTTRSETGRCATNWYAVLFWTVDY